MNALIAEPLACKDGVQFEKKTRLFANCGDRFGKSSESLRKPLSELDTAEICPILSHMQVLSRSFSYFEIFYVTMKPIGLLIRC